MGVVAGLLAPSASHACAVCGVGTGINGSTFFWTTILLSLLPLAMLAAGFIYLRRVVRLHMPDEFEERP